MDLDQREYRFACQRGCTNCCQQEGFVYLTEDDLRQAAAYLQMTPREFEAKYVYRNRQLLRLRVPRRAQCPFLAPDGCSIHPAKPTQCRAYPFWPELVEAAAGWEGACAICPGAGTGQLVQIETVRAAVDEMVRAFPGMYPPRES